MASRNQDYGPIMRTWNRVSSNLLDPVLGEPQSGHLISDAGLNFDFSAQIKCMLNSIELPLIVTSEFALCHP